ncbi:MAG TPA: NAD+ synthase [Spirochaetota bacterium]|nr:NAD+ synthase [Spirochaetota bacterium]
MKIAMAQINPVVADIEGNRKKILNFIERGEAAGADLIVFPELSTIGYPPMDLLESSKLVDDNLHSLAEIRNFTRGKRAVIVIGCVDYDRENPPMLFNSAIVIKDGEIIFRQNKTLLPGYDVFDEYRYFSPAKESAVFELKGIKTGITICEDIWAALGNDNSRFMDQRRYHSEPVKQLADKGAELIINISASPYVKGKRQIRMGMLSALAKKNGVSVVYVNQAGANDSLIFDGNSFCISKGGEIYAHAKGFDEDLLIADTKNVNSIDISVDDIDDIRKALVLGIKDYMHKSGFKKAVLGLSGGIDSALTAALACQAIRPENVTGITMPSMYSSSGSVDDSYELAKNLGVRIETIAIKNLFDQFRSDLDVMFHGMNEDVTEENIQARIRGVLLMSVSNKFNALLLTTGNKSECATGYCTMYGDMCGGLAVISDVPKTIVYEISERINSDAGKEMIPRAIIEKAPSAELRPGQKDQDSLPPYDILDGIIELYVEQRMSAAEIISRGYSRETVDHVLKLINMNEYKRFQAAPGLKVTSKAFGIGRRIPLVKRYVP